jgi:hypothetical protein
MTAADTPVSSSVDSDAIAAYLTAVLDKFRWYLGPGYSGSDTKSKDFLLDVVRRKGVQRARICSDPVYTLGIYGTVPTGGREAFLKGGYN